MNNNDLANLFARINNLIMKGNFNGDDLDEAVYLKNQCYQMYHAIKEDDVEEEEES